VKRTVAQDNIVVVARVPPAVENAKHVRHVLPRDNIVHLAVVLTLEFVRTVTPRLAQLENIVLDVRERMRVHV